MNNVKGVERRHSHGLSRTPLGLDPGPDVQPRCCRVFSAGYRDTCWDLGEKLLVTVGLRLRWPRAFMVRASVSEDKEIESLGQDQVGSDIC